MRKKIAVILVITIILSLASCGADTTSEPKPDTTYESTTVQNTEKQTPEKVEFYAGYARADISPDTFPIAMQNDRNAVRLKDRIYATCVALSDGETTLLIMTLDTRHSSTYFLDEMFNEIKQETGVPRENVLISATHNHSSPYHTLNDEWVQSCIAAVKQIAKEAIADLSSTEAYLGRANSDGLNFVRRYLLQDGTYLSGGSTTQRILAHESEADTEIQLLKFEREGKKDILMVNWQAHAAHAFSTDTNVITADFISKFRYDIEKENDLLFAYYQGAAGNLNLHSLITGKKIQNNYDVVGRKMADICTDALDTLEKAELAKIKVTLSSYTATVDTARYYRAEALIKANDFEPTRLKNYGFVSKTDVRWTYYNSAYRQHNGKNGVLELPITAISIGDIGFVSAPYEMFDTNGMQVKEGSPFKMTFVCAYTNGDYGYIPSSLASSHGGYEVSACCFVNGTGEELADKMINMLKELKD